MQPEGEVGGNVAEAWFAYAQPAACRDLRLWSAWPAAASTIVTTANNSSKPAVSDTVIVDIRAKPDAGRKSPAGLIVAARSSP